MGSVLDKAITGFPAAVFTQLNTEGTLLPSFETINCETRSQKLETKFCLLNSL